MTVETATTIAELDPTLFTEATTGNWTNDHVNLLKSVLKAQFPGAGASGYAVPILASEDELNSLQGVTTNVQTQLNTALTQRIPTVPAAIAGNIAIWNSAGQVVDSGISMQSILDRLAALESA